MAHSVTALLLILLVLVAAWHSQLGLQVIVEDYVRGNGARTLTLVAITFAHVLLGALDEAAMVVARADDQGAAREEMGKTVRRLLEGLRAPAV